MLTYDLQERRIDFALAVEALPSLRVEGYTRVHAASTAAAGIAADGTLIQSQHRSMQTTFVRVETGSRLLDAAASLFVDRALRGEYERMAEAVHRYHYTTRMPTPAPVQEAGGANAPAVPTGAHD